MGHRRLESHGYVEDGVCVGFCLKVDLLSYLKVVMDIEYRAECINGVAQG